jgi:hypothetical protein
MMSAPPTNPYERSDHQERALGVADELSQPV